MRILVVDDEREYGFLLFHWLEKLGYDPVLALDSDHALELLEEGVRAVITDIDMPGRSGVELAREIRRRHEHMPIVFCTGSDPGSEIARGASDLGPVLRKAANLDETREVLRCMLAQLGDGAPPVNE